VVPITEVDDYGTGQQLSQLGDATIAFSVGPNPYPQEIAGAFWAADWHPA
jgi:hypothetical protein